jgi:asparagine synthase (glutamine-hydrolysing)
VFSPDEVGVLLRREFLNSVDYDPQDAYNRTFRECAGETALERVLALDFRTLLANWLILDYKLSSQFGIRPVAPFLDPRVISLALEIPAAMKRGNDEPKALLKRAASGLIPEDVIGRKKVGFRTPMGEMLRAGQEGFVREMLARDNSVFWDLFDVEGVQGEIATHFSGRSNRGWQLWALLCVKQWCLLHVDSEDWR